MANTRTYRWQSGDQIWYVCAKLLSESGFETVSAFVDATRAANPAIVSWASADMPPGTIVSIPYLSP